VPLYKKFVTAANWRTGLFHPCSRRHETSHNLSVAYLTNSSGLANVSILPREKQMKSLLRLDYVEIYLIYSCNVALTLQYDFTASQ